MQSLDPEDIRRAVQAALAEDIGSGDATTLATVPEDATLNVVMRAREALVAAGLPLAEAAFRELAPDLEIEAVAKDGDREVQGRLRNRGERRCESFDGAGHRGDGGGFHFRGREQDIQWVSA